MLKDYNKFLKTHQGITLITLVVTIVVLIIIAGISITVLGGENGIINKAKLAKEESEIAEEKEILGRATVQASGNDIYGKILEEKLQEELDELVGDGKTHVTDIGEEFEVIFKENKRYYSVDKNGNIEGALEIIEDKNPGDITKDKDGNDLDGSEEHPYEIWCIEDLVVFSNMVNGSGIKFENGNIVEITKYNNFSGKYVKLMRTLNFKSQLSYMNSERTDFGNLNGIEEDNNTLKNEMLTGTGFIPIGQGVYAFEGNFNGNNYNINKIYINRENLAGLFGATKKAVIKNIRIDGEITSTKDTAAGIVASGTQSNIDNCINYATIITTNEDPKKLIDGGTTYTNSFSGGIAGRFTEQGVINKCINYGKIFTKKTYSAGIVAFCVGTIKNSVNYGEIIAEASVAAGIGGYEYAGETNIINCANHGYVKSPYIAAGIWGKQIAGKVSIYNSYNIGKVESEQIVGGIYGQTYVTTKSTITNCYNGGLLIGQTSIGGILGNVYGGTQVITNSYFIDNVEKEIGNKDQQTSTKYSASEKELVLKGLNDYIQNNPEITNDWLHWRIEKDNIIFE